MSKWSGWGDTFANEPEIDTPSPVKKFVKEQATEVVDKTKAGKIEAKAGEVLTNVIQKGQEGNIFTRNLTNVALSAMNLASKVIVPITQGASTLALTPQAVARGKGLNSFAYAKEKSKEISMGQAVAAPIGQGIGKFIPGDIGPSFTDEGFDVFNDQQRNKAFKDEWIGIFASGSTDLALATLGTKGARNITSGAKNAVVGPTTVRNGDLTAFRDNLKVTTDWAARADGTPPPNGLAVLVDDAVKETNLTKLAANPLVNETNNPVRTATILSRLNNHDDVADYLLAERGDAAAFTRFMQRQPLEADHIDNFGIKDYAPLSDWDQIKDEHLTPDLTNRYKRIIEAKKAKDKTFASALDDFASMVGEGERVDFVPGKFAKYEQLQLAKNKVKLQAKYGDLKLFGEDGGQGWRSKLYQSNQYERGVRVIAYVGSGRPQGHINISNPRRFEAASDLLSDLNRLQFLRGTEGTQFKRKQVERFLAAQTDTQRAIALAKIEESVFIELGRKYGVNELLDVANPNLAKENAAIIEQISKWVSGKTGRRQTLKKYAVDNGMIPDEQGTINITNNFTSISNEAQTLPMLDFRKLETEIILHVNRELKEGPITPGQVKSARLTQTGMALSQLFDVANMVFSNLNLLRIAYIPKNSIVDPLARASMATESLELFRNAIPAVKNALYNNSVRLTNLSKFVPNMPGNKAYKAEQHALEQIRQISRDKEFPKYIKAWDESKVKFEQAQKEFEKALAVQKKAEAALAKASKANKAKATDAKHAADDLAIEAEENFLSIQTELNRNAHIVQGISSLIEKQRAKVAPSIIARGDKKQQKRLGQVAEQWEIDGKTYTIKGLLDPNQRGSQAYMTEIDTLENFYATGMRSEINNRLRAEGRRFVSIDRADSEAYFNALAHIANRQIRNELELPLGMIMRGDKDGDVLNWIYQSGNAGREWRRRMADRGYTTKDEYITWISETKDKLLTMYPSKEVRDIILERPISTDEITALMKNRPDLAETIEGPNINLSDLNKVDRIGARVGGTTDAAWKILADAETKMVRAPLFKKYWSEELRTLITNARRTGADPSDYFINNQLNDIARRKALVRVEQTLYSSRRLTNGMYAARYAMSFPVAFFNSQAVALRLLAKNPMNAYWYSSITQALDEFESYEDKEGNTYKSIKDVPAGTPVTVKFPIYNKTPDQIKSILRPFVDERGGGLRVNPKQLEFMIGDPSVSWIGSGTLSSLINNGFGLGTPFNIYGEEIDKGLRKLFGDDFYENSVLYGGYPSEGNTLFHAYASTMMPGYMQSLLKVIGVDRGERWFDGVTVSYKAAVAEWVRNGEVGEPPTFDQAAKNEGWVNFLRASVQFFSPISITFDPVTRSAIDYYAKLVEANKGDYDAADAQFKKDWGYDGFVLLGSTRKNVAGLSSSYDDVKILRDNPDLLTKIARTNMKYAGMLSTGYGKELTSEYSSVVASIYKYLDYPGKSKTPISRQKTEDEVQKEVESNLGWIEFSRLEELRNSRMYEFGVGSTYDPRYELSGIQDDYKARVEELSVRYPGWADTRRDNQREFWTELFPVVKVIASDMNWRKQADTESNKWADIALWIEQAEAFHKKYEAAGATDAMRYDMRASFSQFHFDFLQNASDEFSVFATRYLNSMPELNPDLVMRRPK